jgi:SAM-dependent methyltransferase
VSERVDFSANAPVYDRRHGTVLALDVVRKLAHCGSLEPGCRVLDIGAGTGRVAIAFASIGCETIGFDPAIAMLNEARRKAPHIRMHIVAGEGSRLPFAKGHFDAVILARTLYLMADWRMVLREARDVLKPGGRLFHEWGNGQADEPWVQIREKARRLFENAGVENPFHPGARSEAEVDTCLMKLGFERVDELDTGPGPSMTLQDFIARIASGELSYIWNVPEDARKSCLPELNRWCEQTFDLSQPMPIPREIRWTIYRSADYFSR